MFPEGKDAITEQAVQSPEVSVHSNSPEKGDEADTFPEGGIRAWMCAVGTAGVTFATLGFINSFG